MVNSLLKLVSYVSLLIFLPNSINASNGYTPMWEISSEWVCNKIYEFEIEINKNNNSTILRKDSLGTTDTRFINFSNSSLTISDGFKFKIIDKKQIMNNSLIFVKGTGDNSLYEGVMQITSNILENTYILKDINFYDYSGNTFFSIQNTINKCNPIN